MSPPSSSESSPIAEQTRWFAEEVHVHEFRLKAYLRATFPSVRDVDDVVQESYVRICRAYAKQRISSAKAFLFRIARHVALDTLRHDRASPFLTATDLVVANIQDDRRGVADTAAINQEVKLLLEAIDHLPTRCREIIILHKLQRLSRTEVAARLGISDQTVSAQMTRAIQKCESYLTKRGVRI